MKLFGNKKFNVDYDGCKENYRNGRSSYPADSQVTLNFYVFDPQAKYTFYLDGEELTAECNGKEYEVSFVMPAHDVKLSYSQKNETLDEQSETMLVDCYQQPDCSENCDAHYEMVVSKINQDYILSVYTKNEGENEQCRRYTLSEESIQDINVLLENCQLEKWQNDANNTRLNDQLISVKYLKDGQYITISSEQMPDNGEEVLNTISNALEKLIDSDNYINE